MHLRWRLNYSYTLLMRNIDCFTRFARKRTIQLSKEWLKLKWNIVNVWSLLIFHSFIHWFDRNYAVKLRSKAIKTTKGLLKSSSCTKTTYKPFLASTRRLESSEQTLIGNGRIDLSIIIYVTRLISTNTFNCSALNS